MILRFRQERRLADNPALAAASRPLLPVFLLDAAATGDRAPGGAARRWLRRPWDAPATVLRGGGKSCPLPVIDHATGHARALAAFAAMGGGAAGEDG